MKLIFYLPETDDVEQSVCRLGLFLNIMIDHNNNNNLKKKTKRFIHLIFATHRIRTE